MILTDNIIYLKKYYPRILQFVQQTELNDEADSYQLINAKNGELTLQYNAGKASHYLHSAYNPSSEAEKWAEQYEEIDEDKHVFFYGVGLGYHLEALMKKYPNNKYTILEPVKEIWGKTLERLELSKYSKMITNVFVEFQDSDLEAYISYFIDNVKQEVLLICNPVYERIYREKTDFFLNRFMFLLQGRKNTFSASVGFEKLWTFNSVMNLEKVISSPNIFKALPGFFENKPVLLVAAGPSLQDELDNLRYIKEHGLAYIFAVGSANKALITNNIYPDAVCSYDPLPVNQAVFSEIIENKIDTIPMIFGSSIGYTTLPAYPGPILHMITSQDTISNYYINDCRNNNELEIVNDAPTISVLTLELLARLKCSKIILVGQNFAFRDEQYYSQGINYNFRSIEVSQDEKNMTVFVESVDGEQVATYNAHNVGRWQMENFISRLAGVDIINTTKGGAKIKGTSFKELSSLMSEELKTKVVNPDWYKVEPTPYDLNFISAQGILMNRYFNEMNSVIEDIIKLFRKFEEWCKARNTKSIEKSFPKFDKLFKGLLNNKYFQVFIQPMVRVQYSLLQKEITSIRDCPDAVEKSKLITNTFGRFIFHCNKIIFEVEQHLGVHFHVYLQDKINSRLKKVETN